MAGQWAKYGRISANWYSSNITVYPVPSRISDLQSVNSTTITVRNVQGPYVTASRIRAYANGTNLSDNLRGDVQTGEGNLTDWILTGNLTAENETYQGSGQTFNSTISGIYLGVTRIVNVLNITQSYPALVGTANLKLKAVWDQVSGVLLEVHFAFDIVLGTSKLAYGVENGVIVDSNIFGSGFLPDFKISADPPQANFTSGSSSSSIITLTSLNGFSGNITLLVDNMFCAAIGCPHASLTPSGVKLVSNGTATSTIAFIAILPATYDIKVNATSEGIIHSVTVEFTVNAPLSPPDFSLTATASLSIQAGKSDIATLNISPGDGFVSWVNLTVTVPNGLTFHLDRDSIIGSGTTHLTVTIADNLAPGAYTVTVKAAGGSQIHTKTITVTVTAPPSSSASASNLILGLDPTLFYSVIGAIAAVAIFGGVLAIWAKRPPGPRTQALAGTARFQRNKGQPSKNTSLEVGLALS